MTDGAFEAPRLGFLCNWDPEPQRTWSGSAWHLYRALADVSDTVDVGVRLPVPVRRALQVMGLRRRASEWVSRWEYTQGWETYLARTGARRVRHSGCDAVIEIQDVAALDVPFFLYQDFSYDALAAEFADPTSGARTFFRSLDSATFERRRRRQREIYARAAGVFAMSSWLAKSLVDDSGLPSEKVHLAPPGATSLEAAEGADSDPPPRPGPRTRLLFVGTTFAAKGGDLVVEALSLLRMQVPNITLTVAGPSAWPLPGEPPAGVHFAGRVARSELISLYDRHDLLVMPSRLEGFGIVFVEALGRGLPCIGRRAFAMPELIQPGRNGGLLDSDDPAALAQLVLGVLSDDAIYESTRAERKGVLERYTWARTARLVLDVVQSALA